MTKYLIISLFTFSLNVFGHPGGHGGPPLIVQCPETGCSEKDIREAILRILPMVAESGQINPTWGEVRTVQTIEKVSSGGTPVWMATLENSKSPDSSTRWIYFLISNEGLLIDYAFNRPNVTTVTPKTPVTKILVAGLLILLIASFYFYKKIKKLPIANA